MFLDVTQRYLKLPQNDFDVREDQIIIQAMKNKSYNLIKENMLVNLYLHIVGIRNFKYNRTLPTRFIRKKSPNQQKVSCLFYIGVLFACDV